MEYGYYLFDNKYFINMEVDEKDTFTTVIHELTHLSITLQSKYGVFVQLLNKANSIDQTFSSINSFWINHMRKMQEGCCTFAEMLVILRLNGRLVLKNWIADLKDNNREYYKYVEPLIDIIKYVDENKAAQNTKLFSIDSIYELILNIAVCSCDIDVSEIGEDFFINNKSKKSQNINIDGGKSILFLPDSRFKRLIKELKKELESSDIKDVEVLLERIINNVFENTFSQKVNNNKIASLRDSLNKSKEFIKRLFEQTDNYKLICDVIEPISINSIKPSRLLGYSIPESSNRIYSKHNLCKIDEFHKVQNDIVYVLGDTNTLRETTAKKTLPLAYINDKSPKLSSQYTEIKKLAVSQNVQLKKCFIINGYDYTKKELNLCMINNDKRSIVSFMNRIKSPIVVNYKFYANYKNLLCNDSKNAFIYCDRNYENSIDIINNYADLAGEEKLLFNIIDYTNNNKDCSFSVLIINLKRNHYFILPIVRSSIILIYSDTICGKLKITPGLTIDSSLTDTVDQIISCLYYF